MPKTTSDDDDIVISRFEEHIKGFENEGIGINTIFGFVEWILLTRGLSSGRLFPLDNNNDDDEDISTEGNRLFMSDFRYLFQQEAIYSVVIILGSSYLTAKECFRIDFKGNHDAPNGGRQQIGARLVQALNERKLPAFSKCGTGIHILARVSRHHGLLPGEKSSLSDYDNAFTVIDEDLDIFECPNSFCWITCDNQVGKTADDYCWLLWTRDRIRC
jgi:hypothetical protein